MRLGFSAPPRHWLLAGACLTLPMVTARAADWPQFLGPNRDGTSAETCLTTSWKTGGPAVAWEYPLGAGWAGPVVVGRRVYVAHRIGDQAILDCLEAANGRRVWRSEAATTYRDDFGFDEGPRATPLMAGSNVSMPLVMRSPRERRRCRRQH